MTKKRVNRRNFLKTTAAGASALALTASSYAKVAGANGKLRLGFLGVGGRCQQHLDVILQMQKEGKAVAPVAVCDVWDGQIKPGVIKGRGLYPSAQRCGLKEDDKEHVVRDYRKILDMKDVDAVGIATPDHWHARMAIDALKAGKHVYCEKPMTRTIAEAQAVVDAAKESGCVMTVGVQSMADPTWREAHKYIADGKIGKVMQGQTSYYRNSSVGQWRYYPLTKEMTPKSVDWGMWLGHQFDVNGVKLGPSPDKQPFDRAVWAQWRCYWPFGGGMFTDLFVHQTTHLISAMGVRYPGRVVGSGGIYMEYDNRDVPDTATVIADYNEGCQVVISATMCNDTQLGEMIRGHLATIKFVGSGDYMKGFEVYAQNIQGGPAKPKEGFSTPVYTYENPRWKEEEEKKRKKKPDQKKEPEHNATYCLYENFLECVRSRNRETLCPPELGAAAFCTVNMGVLSYRFGKVLFWDKEERKAKDVDPGWARSWEKRSKERGKPSHVLGWHAGEEGSTLTPPAYQKLEGPWKDGQDPANHSAG
jgi:predicted dehydrogenase